MAEEQVLVRYIDSALAAKNGCRPISIGLRMALEYKKQGWVEILGEHANDSLPEEKPPSKIEQVDDRGFVKVGWATSRFIDSTIRKVGYNLGFKVEQFYGPTFSSVRLPVHDFLIVESNMVGFTSAQLENLRFFQFRGDVPYIFRVVSYDRSQYFQQSLLHAALTIFVSEKIFDYTSELNESIIGEWFIEDKADYYSFWRKISDVTKPKGLVEHKTIVLESTELVVKISDEATESLGLSTGGPELDIEPIVESIDIPEVSEKKTGKKLFRKKNAR